MKELDILLQLINDRSLCDHCEIPICHHCRRAISTVRAPVRPEGALSNDMWTGFASRYVHENSVTVMEMICASACLVTLLSFSMEAEYGNLLQEGVHMQRHRVGARGNVTCFPLPLQELFEELQGLQELKEVGSSPALPRTGEELSHVVVNVAMGKQHPIVDFISYLNEVWVNFCDYVSSVLIHFDFQPFEIQ